MIAHRRQRPLGHREVAIGQDSPEKVSPEKVSPEKVSPEKLHRV